MTNNTDAWFMKESLAYYMSTSSRNGKILEQTRDDGDQYDNDSGISSIGGPTATSRRRRQNLAQTNLNSETKKTELPLKHKSKPKTSETLRNFCDNYKYSIRSQVFVLQMHLKRGARIIRRAAELCFCSRSENYQNRDEIKPDQVSLDFGKSKTLKTETRRASDIRRRQHQVVSNVMLNSIAEEMNEDGQNDEDDCDDRDDDDYENDDDDDDDDCYYDDRFWERHAREPTTKESFCRQEEKILSRLEGTIQMKRHIAKELSDEQMDLPISSLAMFPLGSDQLGQDLIGLEYESSSEQLSLGRSENLERRDRRTKRKPLSSSSSSSSSLSGIGDGDSKKVSRRRGYRVADKSLLGSQTNYMRYEPAAMRPDVARNVRFGRLYWQRAIRTDSSQSGYKSSCSNLSSDEDSIKSNRNSSRFDSNSNEKKCVVCYTNKVNVKTEPCNHHEICSDCFLEIIYQTIKSRKYPLKCVLCRRRIEGIKCSKSLSLNSTYTLLKQVV